MEVLGRQKIILTLVLLVLSMDCGLTEDYRINCGSTSRRAMIGTQIYLGDVGNSSTSFHVGASSPIKDGNPAPGTPFRYLTARIFREPSGYEFQITSGGTYVVRLHFYPFSTPTNLADAVFNVSASGFLLLSNFSVWNAGNPPVIKEFKFSIEVGQFGIHFTPSKNRSFAFVSAIEIIRVLPASKPNQTPTSKPNLTPISEQNRTPTSEANQTPTSEPNQTPTSEANQTPTSEPNQTLTSEPNQTLTSEPNQTPTSKPKKFALPMAGSVGVVVFVLVLIGVFIKRRKANSADNMDSSVLLYGGRSASPSTNDRTANASYVASLNLGLKLPLSEILHATNNFSPKVIIGGGGFGKVYRGTLRDGKKVAVKRSQPGQGQGLYEFQTEILVLTKIRHRHLVSLIGYCDERREMILVYEFMENGTLTDLLYESNEEGSESTSRSLLSWEQRLEICIAAAMGLEYLHRGAGIIHRDVKSTNILLDENYVAKVADFGLSKLSDIDQTHVTTGVKGSLGYLDPEYLTCMLLTQKSDVYSFGVVLLEVLCARPVVKRSAPRKEQSIVEWALSWQRKGQLESVIDPFLVGIINPNSLRKFGETAQKCLRESADVRPSMSQVVWDLRYALDLQQSRSPGDGYADSFTGDSFQYLPPSGVPFLPSESFLRIDEDEASVEGGDVGSEPTASEVFSQLGISGAR